MFVPDNPYQPSLMFVGKARGGAPEIHVKIKRKYFVDIDETIVYSIFGLLRKNNMIM